MKALRERGEQSRVHTQAAEGMSGLCHYKPALFMCLASTHCAALNSGEVLR